MATAIEEGFIWVRRSYSSSKYQVVINSVNERTRVISASFTKAVAPEVGKFKIIVDNNTGYFNSKYVGGEPVEFRYDFSSGTTRRFLGEVEEVKKSYGDAGHRLEIVGSHVGGQLLNKTAIRTYTGLATADSIEKDLVSSFAPSGFTTNNVTASLATPFITLNSVPLWKGMSDVNKLVKDFDLYVDDDKDIHFFQQGTVRNDDEAIIFGDNLIELESLGTDTLDVRNKIRIYGKSGDLPVIYTVQDSSSQLKYGVREKVVKSNDVTTEQEAQDLAEATLALSRNTFNVGGGTSLMLPSLNPGDFVYVSSPLHGVLGRYRIIKFTHKVPDELTEFEVEDARA